MSLTVQRPSITRLVVFAAGDFAFNLYWQSIMLYLLFYYTEALHLSVTTAATCYAIASVWDGVASLVVGVVADRYVRPERFRPALIWGAVPLGLTFVLAYAPLPLDGRWLVAWVIFGHLLFRTAYALVNVPYLAMSARVSVESNDRALVAGCRMFFGTLAAVVVAIGTVPIGKMFSHTENAEAYGAAALVFAVIGSILLILVGLTYRDDQALPQSFPAVSIKSAFLGAAKNRAFVTLCAAIMAVIVAVTVLDKSVLYYFKYVQDDETSGQLALGWMMAVSGMAIPAWMIIARYIGVRATWLLAILGCLACLATFIFGQISKPDDVLLFLIAIQTAIVGLHFAFWALLPDTIEYGQDKSGIRAEAVLYGLAALLQRLAIGAGTLFVGFGLGRNGLHHAAAGEASYKLLLAFFPLGFFVLAGVFMILNPLRREAHSRIVAQLTQK